MQMHLRALEAAQSTALSRGGRDFSLSPGTWQELAAEEYPNGMYGSVLN